MSNIHKWNPELGELSIDTLRKIYPRDSFYIAHHVYPPGTSFHAIVRPSLMCIIRGECVIEFSTLERYSEGDVATVEGGRYELRVPQASELEIAFVCDLIKLQKKGNN
jgi:hypothetical protein